MIVYKLQNRINGKIYVGQTIKKVSVRISEHIQTNESYIQKALNKYGLQSFEISIIDEADNREVLDEKERYWIGFYGCKVPDGYNLTDGGDGLRNPTEEVRRKMSQPGEKNGMYGKQHSEEARIKMRDRQKAGGFRKGKHHSEEAIKLIKDKRQLQGPFSEESRRKMRENHANFRGDRNPNSKARRIQAV